jgi:hypothetical protein
LKKVSIFYDISSSTKRAIHPCGLGELKSSAGYNAASVDFIIVKSGEECNRKMNRVLPRICRETKKSCLPLGTATVPALFPTPGLPPTPT